MKKTIKDLNLSGKNVLLRVDFNVPLKDGVVKDDNRIKEAMPTINYLVEHEAKVVLCSHLGKVDHKDPVKCEENKKKNDMKFVVETLENLLGKKVYYVDEVYGSKVDETLASLKNGEVMLLQNTRYEKGESKNDPELSQEMAKNIDVFVMGDDWTGKFDFLREEGVEVIYLPRTPEISTTHIKETLKK